MHHSATNDIARAVDAECAPERARQSGAASDGPAEANASASASAADSAISAGAPGATWPEPEPLNKQLLVAFSHSNRAMQARTRAQGLMPGQPKVLEHLVAHDGCTQRDIARSCVMDKSTVTSVLGRMEEAGLVTRRHRPGDRRASAVFLTDRGRAAAEDVLACRAEVNAIGWQGLAPADRAALSALLARVIENFSASEEAGGGA